jgi:hypothetical protein
MRFAKGPIVSENGESMRRIGFVDLQIKGTDDPSSSPSASSGGKVGMESLVVHAFKFASGKYEWEETIRPSEECPPPSGPLLPGVKDFYLSLPLQLLHFRILKLPFSDPAKLREVIPFELDSLILDGVDDIVFDPMVLGCTDGIFDILVAYAKRAALKEILGKLAPLQIDPAVITSLELQSLLKSGPKDMAAHLLKPGGLLLGPEDRIDLAKEELLAPTFNLRTGPFAYTKDIEKRNRALKLMAGLSLLLVLLIHADLLLRAITAKKETTSIRAEMRSHYASLFPNEKKITDELYLMKSHMKEIREKGDALMDMDLLQFLVDVSGRNVPNVRFHEISVDKDLITMKGEGGSMNEIDKLKTGLAEFLKEISISEMKPSNAGRFFFTLIAKGRKR